MLRSIGLGGDGDEVDAIEAAFARFGLAVPIDDAKGWVTVGDVWGSLERLAPKVATQPATWELFTGALCDETGADHRRVDKEPRLLA
jgi:hypothetical protein